MADTDPKGFKRNSADKEGSSRKKVKKEDEDEEPKYNPYLAHMKEENGFKSEEGAIDASSPFAGFKQRATTAKQAEQVEDLDTNAFTGRPHSQKYFQILQSRRDLPVQKQRYGTL